MKILKSSFLLFLAITIAWNIPWLSGQTVSAAPVSGISMDLSVNNKVSDTGPSGSTFTYKVSFSFSSVDPAATFNDLQIVLPLPADVVFEDAVYPEDIINSGSLVGSEIVFNFYSKPAAGTTYTLQVNAHYPHFTTKDGTKGITTAKFVQGGTLIQETDPVDYTATAVAVWELTKQMVMPHTPLLPLGGAGNSGNAKYEIFFNNLMTGNNANRGILDIENVVIQDVLPPEAVYLNSSPSSVYDAVYRTVTWTIPGPIHDDQLFYVNVAYPSITDQDIIDNKQVINLATADYNPIGQPPAPQLQDSIMHGFTKIPEDPYGIGIHKWVNERQREISPGQDVTFYINGIGNQSNSTLDNLQVIDLVPTQTQSGNAVNMTLKSIMPAKFDDINTTPSLADDTYQAWFSTVANPVWSNSGDWQPGPIIDANNPVLLDNLTTWVGGSKITGVKFMFPNGLPVSFSQVPGSHFQLTYTLNSFSNFDGTNGQIIRNVADSRYTFMGVPKHNSHYADIGVWGARPLIKLEKDIVGGNSYKHGDTVKFKITVENNQEFSSSVFRDPIVIDMLPKELDPASVVWSLDDFQGLGLPALTLDANTPSFAGGNETLLRWKFSGPVTLPIGKSYAINVEAKIKMYTSPGNYNNAAQITSLTEPYFNDYYFNPVDNDTQNRAGDSNNTGILVTRMVPFTVNESVKLSSVKMVRGELDDPLIDNGWRKGDLANLARTTEGGRVDYKLTVKNESNIPVTDIVIIDVLPKQGDSGVIDNSSRGTEWSTVLIDAVPAIANVAVQYSVSDNVKMETGVWTTTPPADLTTVTALKFIFNTGYILQPGDSTDIVWSMKAPVGTPTTKIAWNSFGYKAKQVNNGAAILAAEPPKVGVNIVPIPPNTPSLGNYVWVDLDENGIQNEGAQWGVNGVRVDLLDAENADAPVQKFGQPVFTVTGDDKDGNPGYYKFSNLTANHKYKVRFHMPSTLPSGYTANQFSSWTLKNSPGSTADNDSDVGGNSPTTVTNQITLTTVEDLSWDAGLVPPKGAIGDYVWHDVNGNGLQDEAATNGLNGVPVELYKETAPGAWTKQGATVLTANKGGNPGYYEFTGLLPGKYRVKFPETSGTRILTFKGKGSDRNADSNANANGYTDDINLRLGEIIDTIDAGYVVPVKLGDYVWEDGDVDGQQGGAGDSPRAGVVVNLLDSSNNPVKETDGTTNRTVTTAANGKYLFDNLLPGSYKVEFALPPGYGFTKKAQGASATDSDVNRSANNAPTVQTSGRTDVYSLPNPGDSNLDIDAGIVKLVSLGDKVWMDKNRDGIQDTDEDGVSGVSVKLYYDDISTTVAHRTTTTDANGDYKFNNLYPGKYTVEFVRPGGYLFTAKGNVADPLTSKVNVPAANVNTAKTDQVTLKVTDNLIQDAGLVKLAAVGDKVWLDANDNGIQDAGEDPIAGIKVALLDSSGNLVTSDAYGTAISEITTTSTGLYKFSNLLPGNYQVRFTLPAGHWFAKPKVATATNSTDSDAIPTANTKIGIAAVTLAAGDDILTVDAGVLTLASLGDRVWKDTNGNGIQDSGEPDVSGVEVQLLDGTGVPVTIDGYGDPITIQTTGSDGLYLFENLLPGNYRVKFFNLPADYEFTEKGKGTAATGSAADKTTGISDTVTLNRAQNLNVDAGIVLRTKIGDRVWYDKNGDGIQDTDHVLEPGVKDITVELYNAANTLLKTTKTDVNGIYEFNQLWPDTYYVKFILPNDLYILTTKNVSGVATANDSDADTSTGKTDLITVNSGDVIDTIDAGIVELASIGNLVWVDSNDNGIQDPGEPGYEGATVHLLDQNSDPVMNGGTPVTATTNANGEYLFDKLLPGTYQVKFDLPSGYMRAKTGAGTPATDSDANTVTGISGPVTLTPGDHVVTIDAGLVKLAELGDLVWMDRNLNGIQDVGETGVQGVLVTLLDENGVPIQSNGANVTTITDTDGKYAFKSLVPGKYRVKFELPSNRYLYTTQGSGSSIALDSDADPNAGVTQGWTGVVTLSSGDVNHTLDAGLIELVNLGDTLWVDSGVIGQQDGEAVDPVVANVKVSLLNEDGVTPVLIGGTAATTLTDAQGKYLFSNLYPGKYRVKFDLPAGYLFTRSHLSGNGADATNDSNVDASGLSDVITLVAGSDDLTVDAGIVLPASLGDYVWNDTNANGIQDAGEPGINDIQVDLFNESGTLIATTKTADNAGSPGYYSFTNLVPGTYSVKFTVLPGNIFTMKSSGTNVALDSNAGLDGTTDPVTLAPGENNTTIDAGMYVYYIPAGAFPLASIGDYVWIDSNADGIQDAGESGLNGVTVELYNINNAKIATKVTANHPDTKKPGYYLFKDLIPGKYSVKFIVPNGYMLSPKKAGKNDELDSDADEDGKTAAFDLWSGQNNLTLDAGLIPLASVGDYVWIDSNGNGIQESSEVGQNGIAVTLFNSSGSQIASTLTSNGSNGFPGYYEFNELLPGTYSIKFELPTGYLFTKKHAGSSTATDSDADANGNTAKFTLKSGERNLTIDAGLVLKKIPKPEEEKEKPGKETDKPDKGTGSAGNGGSGSGKGGTVPDKDKPKGDGKSGTTGGKHTTNNGKDSKDGKNALPKTGESMPLMPIAGYALTLTAIALLSCRWYIRRRLTK
ncbi:SdrD B-like domain-containing protein [Cohnella mopanensis]|uniref:SdrD B-like domain-containing protein n=1 Tax=Cohnella mopanensis TaxID=2911966 RepID=UPI001EF78332|nr:SdrD B-like domain-containing protein [Cohnella mopanensis]